MAPPPKGFLSLTFGSRDHGRFSNTSPSVVLIYFGALNVLERSEGNDKREKKRKFVGYRFLGAIIFDGAVSSAVNDAGRQFHKLIFSGINKKTTNIFYDRKKHKLLC